MLRHEYRGYTAVQDIRSPDLTVYGVEAGSLAMGAPDNDANKRVVQGGLWHDSRTKKITNHGSWILKFHFPESRK